MFEWKLWWAEETLWHSQASLTITYIDMMSFVTLVNNWTVDDIDLQMTLSRGWPWPLPCRLLGLLASGRGGNIFFSGICGWRLRYLFSTSVLLYACRACAGLSSPYDPYIVHVCVALDLIVCQCIRVCITVDCHGSTLHLIDTLGQRACHCTICNKTHL